ncbi:methionine-R-sulfoxide reductase [Batrachochytrium salamandrivorans]|nr:methionine-R-sulfoxide reductase [Batrachochytrium salamandrivorans]
MSSFPQSEQEWRNKLTAKEFHVLREKGTEPPRVGEYDKFYPKEGYFACRGCGNPLYSAQAKFDSGCGWPAFDKCYKGAIATHMDGSLFMRRIEIVCAKCGGAPGPRVRGREDDAHERETLRQLTVGEIRSRLRTRQRGRVGGSTRSRGSPPSAIGAAQWTV